MTKVPTPLKRLLALFAVVLVGAAVAAPKTAYAYGTSTEPFASAGKSGGNITLTQDVTLDDYWYITEGKSVVIDLNGHTLKRSISSAVKYGCVIYMEEGSSLTIKDSSAGQTGKITGGYSKSYGGGIQTESSCKLYLDGGAITGNTSTSGGAGVYLGQDGWFYFSGGAISNNDARGGYGGGVYTDKDSKFYMYGNTSITGNKAGEKGYGGGVYTYKSYTEFYGNAVISNNTAKRGAGIFSNATQDYSTYGTYIGGNTKITGNVASDQGGGIYAEYDSRVALGQFTTDRVEITGNTAKYGGGIYADSANYFYVLSQYHAYFHFAGSTQVKNNTATSSTGPNMYVNCGTSVGIPLERCVSLRDTALLNDDAYIGIDVSGRGTFLSNANGTEEDIGESGWLDFTAETVNTGAFHSDSSSGYYALYYEDEYASISGPGSFDWGKHSHSTTVSSVTLKDADNNVVATSTDVRNNMVYVTVPYAYRNNLNFKVQFNGKYDTVHRLISVDPESFYNNVVETYSGNTTVSFANGSQVFYLSFTGGPIHTPFRIKLAVAESATYTVATASDGHCTAKASAAVAAKGATISLSASGFDEGYEFDRWEVKDASGNSIAVTAGSGSSATFSMPETDVVATAICRQSEYSVTVNGAKLTGTYHAGDAVEVSTEVPEHYAFMGWTQTAGSKKGSFADASAAATTFVMPACDVELGGATAQSEWQTSVTGGTICWEDTTELQAPKTSGWYPAGTQLVVKYSDAAAPEGMTFSKWEVNAGGAESYLSGSTASFTTVEGDSTIEALYKTGSYNVTVQDGSGSGSYAYHSTVTIRPSEKPGYSFAGWGVSPEGVATPVEQEDGSYTFTMPSKDVTVAAQYEANSYTLTLVGTDVVATADGAKYKSGDKVPCGTELSITAGAPTGKTFGCWSVKAADEEEYLVGGEPLTLAMPAGDMTVAVVYREVKYNLAVTNGSAMVRGTTASQAAYGAKVTVTANTHAGYAFSGWTDEGSKTGLSADQLKSSVLSFYMPAADVQLTANYTANVHKLTFGADEGGSVTATQDDVGIASGGSYEKGAAFEFIAMPADGMAFDHWEITVDGKVYTVSANPAVLNMPGSDMEVRAVFAEHEAASYTVSVTNGAAYDTGGNAASQFAKGETVALKAIAAPAGYEFAGWKVEGADVEDATSADISFAMPAANVTAEASFTAKGYVLTFGSDVTAMVDSQTIASGDKVAAGTDVAFTAAPSEGKAFACWKVSLADGTSYEVSTVNPDTLTMPASDAQVEAEYSDIVYTVVVAGGTAKNADGVETSSFTAGETVTLVADEPDGGSRFAGWTIEGVSVEDCSQASIAFVMPAGNVIATASFTGSEYALTAVNARVEGGGTSFASGAEVKLTPVAPGRGMRLVYWELTAGSDVTRLKSSEDGSLTITMPAGDATIKAVFKRLHDVVVVGGSGTGSYAEGDDVTVAANELEGYEFTKWQDEEDAISEAEALENNLTFDMPDKDVLLVANYRKTCKIDVNNARVTAADGAEIDAGNVEPGTRVRLEASGDSAAFVGWELEGVELADEQRTSSTVEFVMPEGDVMGRAVFAYEVTLNNASYCTAEAGDKVSIELPLESFKGWSGNEGLGDWNWSTDESTGVGTATFTMPEANVALTATYWNTVDSIDITMDDLEDPQGAVTASSNGGEDDEAASKYVLANVSTYATSGPGGITTIGFIASINSTDWPDLRFADEVLVTVNGTRFLATVDEGLLTVAVEADFLNGNVELQGIEVDDVDDVPNGTTLESMQASGVLPPYAVLVTTGGALRAPIVWDLASASPAYDPTSTAKQTFTLTGTVELPASVDNPQGISSTVTTTVTVLAKDEPALPVAQKHVLSFVTNGGSELPRAQFDEGAVVDLSQYISSRGGYVFAGWYVDEALTQRVTELTMDADATVYAKWVKSGNGSGGDNGDNGGNGGNTSGGADDISSGNGTVGAGASGSTTTNGAGASANVGLARTGDGLSQAAGVVGLLGIAAVALAAVAYRRIGGRSRN